MSIKTETAGYKIVSTPEGIVYQFFCGLSGAMCVETASYKDDDPKNELMTAWNKEGRAHFNLCHKCGRWIHDVMFNPDVLNCVECSPIEDIPDYCPKCGERIRTTSTFCHKCGSRLMYGGDFDEDP